MKCEHKSFAANVQVNRIEDVGRFMADVSVCCIDCGTRFRFIGLPAGLDYNSPCVSVDGCEGRFPIHPKDESLSELEGTPQGFTIRKQGPFDGRTGTTNPTAGRKGPPPPGQQDG